VIAESVLAPVAARLRPRTGYETTTLSMVEPAAEGSSSRPYQAPGLGLAAVRLIGLAGVASARSVPATRSSARLVSKPAPITSVVAKVSVTPAAIDSVTPGATVRSPATA
jgi:hypothetical protein